MVLRFPFGNTPPRTTILGGWESGEIQLSSSDDLNNCKTKWRRYVWSSAPSNAPCTYGVAYVLSSGFGVQFVQIVFHRASASERVYYRYYDNAWGEWQELSSNIPSFYKDYTTLAAFANAAGSLPVITQDLDDVKNIDRCGFYLAQGGRCANRPEDTSEYWAIIAFKTHSPSFWPLLAVGAQGTRAYIGLLNGTTLNWNKVAFE